jgi:agmatinase
MRNFLGLEETFTVYEKARAVIVPIPFEQTTSYMQGTRRGPEAIIDASAYVELYDEELESEVYKAGIHSMPPLLFDAHIEDGFNMISEYIDRLLMDDKFPVILGGEHSITFPVVRAFLNHYKQISVLQLDAHADLRDQYENTRFSHACVMRRIYELTPRVEQVGIRSLSREEAEFARERNCAISYAHILHSEGFPDDIIDRLEDPLFVTIDLDYFDPSLIPATGTPEPGGFFWPETLDFLRRVFTKRNVVGFDVVELSPINGMIHPDFTAAKLIYKLLGYRFSER